MLVIIMLVSAMVSMLGVVVGWLGYDYKNKYIQKAGYLMMFQTLPVFIIVFGTYIGRML